jgi:DNA-binding transcriptional regulator YiaG
MWSSLAEIPPLLIAVQNLLSHPSMEALSQFAMSMTVVRSAPQLEPCLDQSCAGTRFGGFLRQLRLSVSGKQAWLSHAVGCSDAAISFWETGARLPTPRRMAALLAVLSAAGVSTMELLDLRQRWQFERSHRGTMLT